MALLLSHSVLMESHHRHKKAIESKAHSLPIMGFTTSEQSTADLEIKSVLMKDKGWDQLQMGPVTGFSF